MLKWLPGTQTSVCVCVLLWFLLILIYLFNHFFFVVVVFWGFIHFGFSRLALFSVRPGYYENVQEFYSVNQFHFHSGEQKAKQIK